MRKTRQQLLGEMLQAKEELKKKDRDLVEVYDRNKIAAMYLQTLRVMFNLIGGHMGTDDFDRLLDTLDRDRYPEGF